MGNADYEQSIDSLTQTFAEHVAAERGALRHAKRMQEGFRVSTTSSASRKRQRTVSVESERSDDLVKRELRPRRKSLHDDYVSQAESSKRRASTSRFPRRAKQMLPSLEEEALAKSYENAALQRVEAEEAQAALAKSRKALMEIELSSDSEMDENGDEDGEDEIILSVVHPKQRVRDRSLTSDRMSLTPVIMDDDVETDSEDRRRAEERRRQAQMQMQALLALREGSQLRSDQSLHTSLLVGRSMPSHSAGPPGLRLRVDAIIIPWRKGQRRTDANVNNVFNGRYVLCKLKDIMRISRPPPRLYPPYSSERVARGLRNIQFEPQGEDALSTKLANSIEPHVATDKALKDLARAELVRWRDNSDPIRLLPRQDQQYTTVRSSLGTWRAAHSAASPVASSGNPLQPRNLMAQVSQPQLGQGQNVGAARSNMALAARNFLPPSNVTNEPQLAMFPPQISGRVHQPNSYLPLRPSGMGRGAENLEMPQIGGRIVVANQAQPPLWDQQQTGNMQPAHQSPVIPESNRLMHQGTLPSTTGMGISQGISLDAFANQVYIEAYRRYYDEKQQRMGRG